MSRKTNLHPKPIGHVWVPAAMIGGLSLILAGGLELLGWLHQLNGQIAQKVALDGTGNFPRQLAPWTLWLAATVFAIGLAAAMLGTSGAQRRMILWLTAVVLVAAWAPVLSLAAYAPEIGAPWIATVWSGMCAWVYAANHRMPSDMMSRRLPPHPPRTHPG